MTKDVYSGRRIRGIQNRFKHEGQFFFPVRNAIYSITFQRSWPGDMIGIYVEESWDRESGAHSKDYGCHTWNVTPLCE